MYSISLPVDDSGLVIDLISLDELKGILNITTSDHDDVLQSEITNQSGAIADMIDRILAHQEYIETFYFAPNESWCGSLQLHEYPVREIHSITVGGSLLSVNDYRVNPKNGMLYRVNGRWGYNGMLGDIIVDYEAGYDLPEQAPEGLQNAIVKLLRDRALLLTSSGSTGGIAGANVRSVSHGDVSISFDNSSTVESSSSRSESATGVPPSIADDLGPYRRWYK